MAGSRGNPNPVQVYSGAELVQFQTPASKARPGNSNALVHGLNSRNKVVLKLRSRAVFRLVRNLYGIAPWLTATDRSTVQSWAEVVKLKAAAFAALERDGPYRLTPDGDTVGRRLLGEYARLAVLELAYAKELGLTPAARASLGVSVATGRHMDLASAIAQARLSADGQANVHNLPTLGGGAVTPASLPTLADTPDMPADGPSVPADARDGLRTAPESTGAEGGPQ